MGSSHAPLPRWRPCGCRADGTVMCTPHAAEAMHARLDGERVPTHDTLGQRLNLGQRLDQRGLTRA